MKNWVKTQYFNPFFGQKKKIFAKNLNKKIIFILYFGERNARNMSLTTKIKKLEILNPDQR
jgi:hypothetical protein